MTNEIKEKIEYLKKVTGIYEGARITEIEDYITNLQEENERLKLNQTKKVFDTIAGLIKNGETCSYRYLIYDLLGFQEKDYVDLMGGLAITNMLVDYEDFQQRIGKAVEYINKYEYQRYCPSPYEKDKYIMREEKEGQDLLDILRGDE